MFAYSASLTSILAVQKDVYPFRTFDEFFHSSPYKMLGLKGSGWTDHFRLGGGVMTKIYEEKFIFATSVVDAIDRMLTQPNLAYSAAVLPIYAATNSSCRIRPLPGMSRSGPMTIYLTKNSSYVQLLNYQ